MESMISAHPTEQIFVHLVICPYCSMGEEESKLQILTTVNFSEKSYIFPLLTPMLL